MDDDLRGTLFDPAASHDLVLTRRRHPGSAVDDVVSDVVWGEVVRLLRWAAAGSWTSGRLARGIWWRLAQGCAELLRRMPGLSAEVHEPFGVPDADSVDMSSEAEGTPAERVGRAADRLAEMLRSPEPPTLLALAAAVDALGVAAISAYVDATTWRFQVRP